MAEETKPAKVSVKLLIDTESQKVLFAEAGKDFVDFLLHIFSLPIGTVVKLLTPKGMVGSLGDLCKSIQALNNDYLQPDVSKDSVLKPMITNINPAVKVPTLSLHDNEPTGTSSTVKTFYRCASRSYSNCSGYVADGTGALCPSCHGQMSSVMSYVKGATTGTASPSGGGAGTEGYVKGMVTYMVMDNLEVVPMSTISAITLLNKFHVKDLTSLVEKEAQLGLLEGVALLKASLETKAVLTAVFLK